MKYSLPDSSSDLLIKDGKLLMRALSVYEVLRRFGYILRLTDYRFEDFTAALTAHDQSALLAEIHIQLLKTLIREDRQQQTWLGPPDIRDSVNLYMQMVDHSNWPSAIDIYLSADPRRNAHILEILDGDEKGCYPFSSTLETRLYVLEDLCDRLLLSVLARDDMVGGGTAVEKQTDKSCRICSKANGDLTSCKVCLRNFHLKCSYPNNNEKSADRGELNDESRSSENGRDGPYPQTCKICIDNHVQGVTDCISEEERLGNLKRHEALGLDKLGRRYWFVVRRLFVVDETEDDVRYYTNIRQLREIIESLNENRHEVGLIENLTTQQGEIERQMQITEDLYSTLMKDHKNLDGSYSLSLGQNGLHRNYTNNFPAIASSKLHSSDRDMLRNLNNKFCMTNQIKWNGAINGHLNTITTTVRSSILKFEAQLPGTFIHPCWRAERVAWIKSVNQAQTPLDFGRVLTKLETCIKPVLFKGAWYDSVGFLHLFRSTYFEREEMKKNDRQPRGFERNERTTADFELSYRLGTMVKFSPKLKPVKHQVWKQKGEEYRLTGLNGWYWHGITRRSRCLSKPKLYRNDSYRWSLSTTNHPFVQDMMNNRIKSQDVIDVSYDLNQKDEQHRILYPKIPKYNPYKQARIDKMDGLLQKKLDELERIRQERDKEAILQEQQSNTNGIGGGDTTDVKPILTNGIIQPTLNSIRIEMNGCMTAVSSTTTPNNIKAANQNPGDIKKFNPIITPKKTTIIKPTLPPTHDFLTKRGKVRCIFVLPDLELRRVARSGGQKEARTFSYTAKPNFYVWPYGITPRPTFRTCWLYRNELTTSIQEVALNLKVINANLRWDDLQARPPACGHNIITLDEATVTIELLKKRDKLPYLTHSEYLIRKTTTPVEQPDTKYRKIGTKKSTPSARSGLRARRQAETEDERRPTREEIWVSEFQLELWELKQFDEKIERQQALIRERAQREEAAKRRQAEEAKRRAADAEKRRLKAQQDEANKRVRLSTPILTYQSSKLASPATPPNRLTANNSINIPTQASSTPLPQQGSQTPSTPVLRYFRTDQGQIIRLPASYLQQGTQLILRHVTPGTNQTNTYIIRPQASPIGSPPTANNIGLRLVAPATMIRPQVQPISVPLSTMPATPAATPSAPPATPAAVALQQQQPTPPPAQAKISPMPAASAESAHQPIKVEPAMEVPQPQPPPPPPDAQVAAAVPAESVQQSIKVEPRTTAAQPPPAAAQLTTPMPPPTGPQNIKVEEERAAIQPPPSPQLAFAVPIATTAGPDPTTTVTTTTATTTPATEATASAIEPEPTIPDVETKPVVVANESERPIVATADVVASKSGNENETTGAEQREMSVGTVANEMAHDQHAPSLLVNEPPVSQQIAEEGKRAS